MSHAGEWPCEEIKMDAYGKAYFQDRNTNPIYCSNWNACPICGAKRPEKPMALAQYLHDIYIGRTCSTRDKFAFVAKAVVDWACRIVDKLEFSDWVKDEIKRRLRDGAV